MDGEQVYARQMSAPDLGRLLAELRPRLPFAIVERVDRPDLPAAGVPLSPDDWPRGRAFGPELELRWEPREGGFYVLCASAAPPSADWEPALDLGACRAELRTCYLWGEDNVSLERRPAYPAIAGDRGRPQLTVVEYRDRDADRLVFARYTGMQREALP